MTLGLFERDWVNESTAHGVTVALRQREKVAEPLAQEALVDTLGV